MTTATSFFKNLSEQETLMPVLFMGHGSPMNAIENNEFTQGWEALAKSIPTPKAILCISAHWETKGTQVLTVKQPKMIYDMYGFPQKLYEVNYPCPGAPELAKDIQEMVQHTDIHGSEDWGLDHGAWSVLVKMFPEANIPSFQLSLNQTRDMQWHYDLGEELYDLRKKGVLIIGSGNIVHNLREAKFGAEGAFDWALEFDTAVEKFIQEGDHKSLIHYDKLGRAAQLSVNSAEHYIPLLYTLSLQKEGEPIQFSNEKITFGSAGMRCVRIG